MYLHGFLVIVHEVFLTKLHNGTVEQTVNASNLPAIVSSHFSFSICFYVDDWNHGFGRMKKNVYTSR